MASFSSINAIATGADNEIRMILLGRTGAGKSSVGNTILGNRMFEAKKSPGGVTKRCGSAARDFEGKSLFLVDTPGFLDPNIEEDAIQKEVGTAYELTAMPGPHVFLLVVEPARMTVQENEAVEYLNKIFGENAINHTIIIFTHGDDFDEGNTLEDFLSELQPNSVLQTLLQQCHQRYLLFSNKESAEAKDNMVRNLLRLISDMISDNDNQVYTTNIFAAVAKVVADEKAKGTFSPVKSDGSYALLPQTKEIVLDGYLRRTVGRRANH